LLDRLSLKLAARKQGSRKPRADETGAAGDQQFHGDGS
jgi:hypothetical protein